MSSRNSPAQAAAYLIRLVVVFALVFGTATLFSGGSVPFGPEKSREVAGAYVPLVVWFSFLAGYFCLTAALGRARWGS